MLAANTYIRTGDISLHSTHFDDVVVVVELYFSSSLLAACWLCSFPPTICACVCGARFQNWESEQEKKNALFVFTRVAIMWLLLFSFPHVQLHGVLGIDVSLGKHWIWNDFFFHCVIVILSPISFIVRVVRFCVWVRFSFARVAFALPFKFQHPKLVCIIFIFFRIATPNISDSFLVDGFFVLISWCDKWVSCELLATHCILPAIKVTASYNS